MLVLSARFLINLAPSNRILPKISILIECDVPTKNMVVKKGDQGYTGVTGLRRVPALLPKNSGYSDIILDAEIVHGGNVSAFVQVIGLECVARFNALMSDGFNYYRYPMLYKSLHEMRWYGLLSIAVYIVTNTSLQENQK